MTTPNDDVPAQLAQRPDLLADAAQRALRYLARLDSRPVAPAAAALAGLDRLDFPLPGPGRPGKDVLALLDEAASPATVASGGPRYFGFVIGGALPAAQAAAWLTAAWDQNAALTVMSPAAARLDTVALRWVTELLGLPPGTGGGFVTGASMANATCLAAARDAVLSRHGWDAAGQGLVGAPPVTVLVGEQVHTTVRKALGLTGLGRDRAIVLPTDSQGRIVPHSLPILNAGPALVCLQPGPGGLRPGPDRGGGGCGAARRDLLVRADQLAGPPGHADQRQRLEHHRGRHRPQPGRRTGLRQPGLTGSTRPGLPARRAQAHDQVDGCGQDDRAEQVGQQRVLQDRRAHG
jgi:hypothetical protein